MRAIAVGDEIGIGTAATVGTRDRVAANARNNLKKRVDMFCQGGEKRVVSRGGSVRGRGLRRPGNYEHSFSTASECHGTRAGGRERVDVYHHVELDQ